MAFRNVPGLARALLQPWQVSRIRPIIVMNPLAALLASLAGTSAAQGTSSQPTDAAAGGGLFADLLEAANGDVVAPADGIVDLSAAPTVPLISGVTDPAPGDLEVSILPEGDGVAPAEAGGPLAQIPTPGTSGGPAAPAPPAEGPASSGPSAPFAPIATPAPEAAAKGHAPAATGKSTAAHGHQHGGADGPDPAAGPERPAGPETAQVRAGERPGADGPADATARTGQAAEAQPIATAEAETSVRAAAPGQDAPQKPQASADPRAPAAQFTSADTDTTASAERRPASDTSFAKAPAAQDALADAPADRPSPEAMPKQVLRTGTTNLATGQVLLHLQEQGAGEASAPPRTDVGTLTVQLRPAAASAPQAPAAQVPQVPVHGLAVHIAQQAQNGVKRFDIRLDPPELGRVEVRLDVTREGQVTTHLVVERSETLDMLQRDARSLERALQNAGLDLSEDGMTFSLKDQGLARGDSEERAGEPGPDAERHDGEDDDADPDPQPPSGHYVAATGLDIRI